MKKIFQTKIAFYSMLILFSPTSMSYFETAKDTKSLKEITEMNGIDFTKYYNFTKKWRLVTIRYREDSTEIRAIYANDKAWAGLTKLKPNYPDGAMFGKVAYLTEQDPSFPSSRQPISTMRYQFMLKDQKKYKETNGWGYALFTPNGKLFSGGKKENTLACAACHRVVPERDYIFSRAVQLDPTELPFPEFPNSKNSSFTFSTKKLNSFNKEFRSYLPDYKSNILFLEGEIQKHGFSGTLSEITPLLIEQSKKSLLVSTLFLNEKNFTIVRPNANSATCKVNVEQKAFHVLIIFNGKRVSDSEICQ